MKSYIIITALILILFSIFAYTYSVDSAWRISSELGRSLLKSGNIDLLLDVRTKVERDTLGYVPDSVHIESSDLERDMPNRYPNKEQLILVYCNTGHRARKATDILHKLGYKNSYYISSMHTSLL